MNLRMWLRPGMAIKRWIIALLIGLVLTSLAIAMALAWIYRNYEFPASLTDFVQTITLQFIPHPYRELIMVAIGLVFVVGGFYQLSRSLLAPFWESGHEGDQPLAEIIQAHRFGPRQPELRVVAIGGGTGLSTLLRGLKVHDIDITAVVTVGDDGGSSGRLRTEFNMPPPGDIRNCIVALADSETLMSDLFQYRFEQEGSELYGHSFGNLFITALTQVSGSFEQAVAESSRVLAVRGKVMPSSLENITVCAEMADERHIRGESAIVEESQSISRVYLDPANPTPYDPALLSILSADLIILGPGSLYTSVLPNLLVDRLPEAIRASRAAKVYVCNVATQRGETDGFEAVDHVLALEEHVGRGVVDHVLVNSNLEPAKSLIKPEWSVREVGLGGLDKLDGSVRVVLEDVVNPDFPLRHDPAKLSRALIQLAREHRLTNYQSDAGYADRSGQRGRNENQPFTERNGRGHPAGFRGPTTKEVRQ
ncbi:MAG: uridine diphosphate-N-acetylglucosamine-binding protein YvcK [Thermomicrobiaceae bacterium]